VWPEDPEEMDRAIAKCLKEGRPFRRIPLFAGRRKTTAGARPPSVRSLRQHRLAQDRYPRPTPARRGAWLRFPTAWGPPHAVAPKPRDGTGEPLFAARRPASRRIPDQRDPRRRTRFGNCSWPGASSGPCRLDLHDDEAGQVSQLADETDAARCARRRPRSHAHRTNFLAMLQGDASGRILAKPRSDSAKCPVSFP